MIPVSVVIVSWNSADVLASCLESIAASTPTPAEVIVVDNGSADQSVGLVGAWSARHDDIVTRVLSNDTNRGFAGGANQGIEAASQDLVCLVNPDIRLLPRTLCTLATALDSLPEQVAVAGAKLLRGDGRALAPTSTIDSTGIVMTRDGRHLDRGAGQPDDGRYDAEEDVFGITGALALFRRRVLEDARVDGQVFDEDFFAYREDADLAWRLQGFGYRARYVPTAVAFHRRTVTPERRRSLSPSINRHSVKNRFLLRIHHAERHWLARFGLRSTARDVVVVLACLTIERSSLPALAWLFTNGGRHMRRRREILRRRRSTVESLAHWFGP